MPILLVSGPVIVEDDKVLLAQHGDTNFWKFCGGRVENTDATLKDACIREIKEEMGIDIEFAPKAPYFFYTQKDTPQGPLDVILVHYLAKRIGEIKPGPDIREWIWLPIEELDKYDLAPNIKPVLKYFRFY